MTQTRPEPKVIIIPAKEESPQDQEKKKNLRVAAYCRVSTKKDEQLGSYMLLYLGVISRENMQIEGFWYYLFLGTFEAATIHYAVAKIFGPLLFGRGWCGYACWTAMVLDFLLYQQPQKPRKEKLGILCYECTKVCPTKALH